MAKVQAGGGPSAFLLAASGVVMGQISRSGNVFRETTDTIMPMRGHSLGLLGFEVTDIEGFVKRYSEAGGKFDGTGTIARAQGANLAVIQADRSVRSRRRKTGCSWPWKRASSGIRQRTVIRSRPTL